MLTGIGLAAVALEWIPLPNIRGTIWDYDIISNISVELIGVGITLLVVEQLLSYHERQEHIRRHIPIQKQLDEDLRNIREMRITLQDITHEDIDIRLKGSLMKHITTLDQSVDRLNRLQDVYNSKKFHKLANSFNTSVEKHKNNVQDLQQCAIDNSITSYETKERLNKVLESIAELDALRERIVSQFGIRDNR